MHYPRAMRTLASLGWMVWLCAGTSLAHADVPPGPDAPPAYRVHVIDREAIAGHTLVGLTIEEAPPHGPPPSDGPFSVSYAIVDDFAQGGFDRLCAFPSSRIVDSPLGGLGTRMIQGAPAGASAPILERENITRTLAFFDAEDVACATLAEPPIERGLRARHVEAVEDTIRPTTVEGRTLHVELVSVAYLVTGQSPLVVSALPGGVRPTVPPASHGCACGVGHRASHGGVALLALLGWLVTSRRRARTRSTDPV